MFKFFKNNPFKKLSDSNQAVVGIVVAVLLIGLIVSVLSIVQLVYVPNWMEEIESEHIDDVFNQFCQLKLVIDTQSVNKKNYTPIVTSINLGTNKIPFLMSTRAAGGLDIIPYDDSDACIIDIAYRNKTGVINTSSYHLGTIRFQSANAYYIPDEHISFIYENGALITSQEAGNALNIRPSFAYEINTADPPNGTVYFNLVNISGVGGKISKYGYDIEHIRTEYYYIPNDNITFHNVVSLSITTPHRDVWHSFIKSYLNNKGLEEGHDFTLTAPENNNYVRIEFGDIEPDIELTITGIYAQIGPGWVEID